LRSGENFAVFENISVEKLVAQMLATKEGGGGQGIFDRRPSNHTLAGRWTIVFGCFASDGFIALPSW
jgi:hypothetical protein